MMDMLERLTQKHRCPPHRIRKGAIRKKHRDASKRSRWPYGGGRQPCVVRRFVNSTIERPRAKRSSARRSGSAVRQDRPRQARLLLGTPNGPRDQGTTRFTRSLCSASGLGQATSSPSSPPPHEAGRKPLLVPATRAPAAVEQLSV
jgi:hypothetical protein